jgi:tagaturonate reductase
MTLLRRSTPFALPIKILQFGQGDFMRGFFDWQVDLLNERTGLNAGIVIVRPRGGSAAPLLDTQDGLFTVLVRGLDDTGAPVEQYRTVTCVQREIDPATMYSDYLALAANPDLRFIVSNTTEAGITTNDTDRRDDAPPLTFPAKLTQWLYARYRAFDGAADKGVVLLPCELIDKNGAALKAALLHYARLWALPPGFAGWLDSACTFCNTLVDRIVTGYPSADAARIEADLGYADPFLVAAEYYYLFVIEGPAWVGAALHLDGAGLNIKLVDDITPYKKRKVGILNGAHTTLVPVALLAGLASVGEAVDDAQVGAFLRAAIADDIIPALDMDRAELDAFAADVLRRFRNPAIDHRLAAIALNSWSKFAARVLPQLLRYAELHDGRLPPRLVLAMAATMVLYRGGTIELADDPATLAWFRAGWTRVTAGAWTLADLAAGWLAHAPLWGRDLNAVPGLHAALAAGLARIDAHGVRAALGQGAHTVYAIGECMIELQRGAAPAAMDYRFGGDTLNAAVYMARLLDPGVAQVAYVTGLGTDGMSDEMLASWAREGLVTDCVQRLPERLPGIYLIETAADGERRFHYWRQDSAARHWLAAPQAGAVLARLAMAHTLYLSGISLAILTPPDRDRLLATLAACRGAGGRIVFDNNYRPRLWESAAVACAVYARVLALTDIALLTLDDEVALYGPADAHAVIVRTRALGVAEIVVKCGADPCLVWHDGRLIEVAPAPVADVVDTTAAGDSFGAAYVAARLAGQDPERAARAGHRLAGAVIQQRGAIIARAAMPAQAA